MNKFEQARKAANRIPLCALWCENGQFVQKSDEGRNIVLALIDEAERGAAQVTELEARIVELQLRVMVPRTIDDIEPKTKHERPFAGIFGALSGAEFDGIEEVMEAESRNLDLEMLVKVACQLHSTSCIYAANNSSFAFNITMQKAIAFAPAPSLADVLAKMPKVDDAD